MDACSYCRKYHVPNYVCDEYIKQLKEKTICQKKQITPLAEKKRIMEKKENEFLPRPIQPEK